MCYINNRFLIHRVELKDIHLPLLPSVAKKFLIHRVELKVIMPNVFSTITRVSNSPCGVESLLLHFLKCYKLFWFLIHRVELKDRFPSFCLIFADGVSNSPCGVESSLLSALFNALP